jgi:ArsR family transcriptional regulator, arsenate/arsenite/antimonite-responsive transcriptional repressor
MRIFAYRDGFAGHSTMKDLTRLFKALSDETRIRILKILLERECCVCEVMQALEISQSRASRNLSILENAGFVTSRKDGLWTVYFIDEQQTSGYAFPLMELLRSAAVSEDVVLRDRERLTHAMRLGPRGICKQVRARR